MKALCGTIVCAIALIAGGCATSTKTSADGTPSPKVVSKASAAQQAVMLDQLKALAGTWDQIDEKGNLIPGSVFAVSSAGSVVREIMWGGQQHEMTNVYHMDGDSIVMTHYCAAGNQPRLRCTTAKPGELDFKLDEITNFTSPDQHFMGGLKLTMPDKNTLVATWTNFTKGTPPAPVAFTYKRKA